MATDKLVDGYRRFKRTRFAREQRLYEQLADKGQQPKVLVISCSDSRVSPSVILSAEPGDIFVARNIANIVPPYDPDSKPRSIGAVIEYAVKVLKVSDIVVKGHARCGGVAALVDGGSHLPTNDYLAPWVEIAAPSRSFYPPDFDKLSPEEQRLCSEQANIQNSIQNLSGYPWVRDRMERGSLRIHGWHFDIKDGMLTRLDHESGEWVETR
jgi:carbonic anhydrase